MTGDRHVSDGIDGLDELQRSVHYLADGLWPNETIETAALALCEEVGGVARAVIKRGHQEDGAGGRSHRDWTGNLRIELAQVVMVAMNMAEMEGFSLGDALLEEEQGLAARRIHESMVDYWEALGQRNHQHAHLREHTWDECPMPICRHNQRFHI